ncbi:hypothetical protein H6F61_06345 [Cyanobacteria bacterium FACHB-472]|nr:hypothetical protein [Cyanobacteria bacterium FACHB-472]
MSAMPQMGFLEQISLKLKESKLEYRLLYPSQIYRAVRTRSLGFVIDSLGKVSKLLNQILKLLLL